MNIGWGNVVQGGVKEAEEWTRKGAEWATLWFGADPSSRGDFFRALTEKSTEFGDSHALDCPKFYIGALTIYKLRQGELE